MSNGYGRCFADSEIECGARAGVWANFAAFQRQPAGRQRLHRHRRSRRYWAVFEQLRHADRNCDLVFWTGGQVGRSRRNQPGC